MHFYESARSRRLVQLALVLTLMFPRVGRMRSMRSWRREGGPETNADKDAATGRL